MPTPKVYPSLSYRDPSAAIAFLQQAFGFALLREVPDGEGGVSHAEVALGDDVVMLGSSKPELGWVSPLDLPGAQRDGVLFRGGRGRAWELTGGAAMGWRLRPARLAA